MNNLPGLTTKPLITMIFILSLFTASVRAQGDLSAVPGGADQSFQQFQDFASQQSLDENELLQREFEDKNRKLTLIMQKASPVYFKSDRQEYREAENLYLLEGNVTVSKEDLKLAAERVTINDWTGDVTAEGDVVVRFGKDIISSEKAIFNLETGRGVLYRCRGSLSPSIYFECSALEKLSDYRKTNLAQYYMEAGTMTSCEGPLPDWKIKAPKALARIENYLHLNHPSFWIGSIPALYAPYWVYPIKTERATGFLIPTVAFSRTYGLIFKNAFFWDIADNVDLTFGFDIHTLIGWNQSLEARYALDAYSKGHLYSRHVSEHSSPRTNRNAVERWQGQLYQIHAFPYNINATVNVNYVSDQYFDADYGSEIEWMTNRNLSSYISLTKYWTREHLTADIDYTRDLDKNLRRDLQRIPRLVFNSGSQRIGRSDLRWNLEARFESLLQEGYEYYEKSIVRDDGVQESTVSVNDWLRQQVSRGHIAPELRFYFNQIPWFNFTPWAQYQFTWWSQRKSVNPDYGAGTWATVPEEGEPPDWEGALRGTKRTGSGLVRQLYRMGVDWEGPKFYKIYEFDSTHLLKMKHQFYPAFSFLYVPEINQDEIIYYDYLDEIRPANAITYSLVNLLLGKVAVGAKKSPENLQKRKDTDMASNEFDGLLPEDDETQSIPTTVREFARITLSQTYDSSKEGLFDEYEREYALGLRTQGGTRDDYPYSDIKLETKLQPAQDVTINTGLYYDPYEHDISRADVSAQIYSSRGNMRLGWNANRNLVDDQLDDTNLLSLEGGINLSTSFTTEISTYYDIERDFANYLNTKITYISQCWSVSFHIMYRNKIEEGIYPDWEIFNEYEFGISFRLKNVGDVGFLDLGNAWRQN